MPLIRCFAIVAHIRICGVHFVAWWYLGGIAIRSMIRLTHTLNPLKQIFIAALVYC